MPLVYYSTDYVFDGAKRAPYVESDAPAPLALSDGDVAYRHARNELLEALAEGVPAARC